MFDWLKKRSSPSARDTRASVPPAAPPSPGGPHLFHADNGDGTTSLLLSVLAPETEFPSGLPSQAILGQFVGGESQLDEQHFVPNPEFVELMHSVIAGTLMHCPGVKAEAARQRAGNVFLVDMRTCQPDGSVPPRDIIGTVEVREGRPRSYRPGAHHVVFSEDGPVQLDPWFQARLVEALMRLGASGHA